VRPNLVDFQGLDFKAVFRLGRAYSEGDIQVLDMIDAPLFSLSLALLSSYRVMDN
jgi:hypothetical protein